MAQTFALIVLIFLVAPRCSAIIFDAHLDCFDAVRERSMTPVAYPISSTSFVDLVFVEQESRNVESVNEGAKPGVPTRSKCSATRTRMSPIQQLSCCALISYLSRRRTCMPSRRHRRRRRRCHRRRLRAFGQSSVFRICTPPTTETVLTTVSGAETGTRTQKMKNTRDSASTCQLDRSCLQ